MRNTMKRIFSYAMIIALLFAAESVLAQGYTFRVLANKGSNKLKKANTGQMLALKTGATLGAIVFETQIEGYRNTYDTNGLPRHGIPDV